MATLIPNSFTSWELGEEEVIAGSVFTITQTQVLQNLLATMAEERITAEVDLDNINKFVQEEEYRRGQIEIIQFLLDTSEALQKPAITSS